jgi:hypothetical protein
MAAEMIQHVDPEGLTRGAVIEGIGWTGPSCTASQGYSLEWPSRFSEVGTPKQVDNFLI